MTTDDTNMDHERHELNDLLVRRALEGLDEPASERLDELLARHPDVDPEWADRVVGEIDADPSLEESLSPDLRAALLAAAPPARALGSRPDAGRPAGTATDGRGPAGLLRWGGWLAAAAVAALWLGAPERTTDPLPTWSDVAAMETAVTASWEAGGDVTGDDVTGEIVWSGSAQSGVMRLTGLDANDPGEFQYQLWIFDEARDDRYPVDGGVFDIPAGGGTVDIPVQPTLRVERPTLFAVTVERPGGVVVSDRSRIAATAGVAED